MCCFGIDSHEFHMMWRAKRGEKAWKEAKEEGSYLNARHDKSSRPNSSTQDLEPCLHACPFYLVYQGVPPLLPHSVTWHAILRLTRAKEQQPQKRAK
jgi:hypothetical protein